LVEQIYLWAKKWLKKAKPFLHTHLLWKLEKVWNGNISDMNTIWMLSIWPKFTNMDMNFVVNKKVINSFQNELLSPSCISLSFDIFGSISKHSVFGSVQSKHFRFPIIATKHHWRDIIIISISRDHNFYTKIAIKDTTYKQKQIRYLMIIKM
jgi:hypothetical protein